MVSTIDAFIFDFGGVLIDWDPHKLFNKYFENDTSAIDSFLKEINFRDWNLSQDKGYPFIQAVQDLSERFPQYAHLIHAYDVEWGQSITGTIPETVRIVQRLKAGGNRLYGLTNWSAEKFAIVRHKYEVFDLFESIIVSGEVKLIKPDRAIYLLLLDQIKCEAGNCLLIDDSLRNIQAAQEIGFQTHHFISPTLLEMDLQHLGSL